MEKKGDFFQKNLSNTGVFYKKKSSKAWIWIIVLLFLFIVGVFTWNFYNDIDLNDVDGSDNQDFNFSLGEDVYLQGELRADGDITTHTHTIEDEKYGIIRIKSRSINLSDYAGFVEITGTVEKFYQGNPIVEVIALSGAFALTGNTETNINLNENGGVYILGAGIQFLPSFFDEYVLLNEGENGEIRIQNIGTEKETVLSYFRCNQSDPNKNCKGLNETFANNNAQSFVTSEGDVYYKLSEAQSRFVSNGDWWGIFINDVSDDVVFELKDLIKFANEKNVNEWINFRSMSICQGSGEKLQRINNSEISLKQEGLVVTVSGDGMEKQITCQILVDFSLPEKGKLQSITIGDDVVIQENLEDNQNEEMKDEVAGNDELKISAIVFDTNVSQFPVKEEGLQYKSARGGYVLKFPSSNISYSVSSVKENFGRSDVSCSYVINVIKYSDKENLEISPSIRIYECDGSVDQSWAQGIIVYPRLDKKFVVQMNDGAWNDFSMNLKFEELVEE